MGFLRDTIVTDMMFSVLFVVFVAATGHLAKPGCRDKCGNVTIPYPFGIGKGCYLEEAFSVVCSHHNEPLINVNLYRERPFLLDISLEGWLRIFWEPSYLFNDVNHASFFKSNFVVYKTRNKLVGLGCNTIALLVQPGVTEQLISCLTMCKSASSTFNRTCLGSGCCEAALYRDLTQFTMSVMSLKGTPLSQNFSSNYSYAILVGQGYSFNMPDVLESGPIEYPMVLDWTVGRKKCKEAMKDRETYACKSPDSSCYEPENIAGYRCKCSNGYKGNPYLPKGCHDINECEDPKLNDCKIPHTCQNIKGNYTCDCPSGYHGDGRKQGTGCTPIWTKIVIGLTIGLSVLLMGLSLAYSTLKHKKLREHIFEQNGGFLLRQRLTELERSKEATKVLSAKDLQKAMNNYHESRILGQGSQGTVYKGKLPNNGVVAIKKAKIGDRSQIAQFINEMILLSQINHRNVVKLLGCCLETEVPSLVYEFVSNGSLFDHVHNAVESFVIPWETRLRIAIETAGALMYLHSSASIPIIHRDVKSANILLDDSFRAKVSDFGASKLVPVDKEQLTTLVQGTLGYLDPEYFQTNHLNEKSDVYSFGVVLLELVTGEKAFRP